MNDSIWIAAEYHFPTTYSCRKPMASPYSAPTLPAPGPSTVRLALIKVGIELYGLRHTQKTVFPLVRDASIKIRPPKEIGISTHHLKMYKQDNKHFMRETLGYREFAQTKGNLTIYCLIPSKARQIFAELFDSIGYWGQANSFATCTRIYEEEPIQEDIIHPLSDYPALDSGLKQFFTSFVTEWDYEKATWERVVGIESSAFINTKVYIFPLVYCERQSTDARLLYRSLD